MNKILGGVILTAMGMVFASSASAETLRFATTLPESDNPETHAMQAFKQYVDFHSNGEVEVQLLHGGVGGDREILESVRNNIFQMTATTDGALAPFYPRYRRSQSPIFFLRLGWRSPS